MTSEPTTRLRALFVSVDSDGNGTVDHAEMDAYLTGVGVRSRRVRGIVKTAIVEACGGQLTWERFVSISHHLVPPGIADRNGRLDPDRVDPVFDRIAGRGAPEATLGDVERYVRSTMPFFLRPFAGPLARAGARAVLGALARDRQDAVHRDDLRELVVDIVREKS